MSAVARGKNLPPPLRQEEWQTVLRKWKNRPAIPKEPLPVCSQEMAKSLKKRTRRHEAIMVHTAERISYAEALQVAKTKVTLAALGIKDTRVRYSTSGGFDQIIIPRPKNKVDALVLRIEEYSTVEEVRTAVATA